MILTAFPKKEWAVKIKSAAVNLFERMYPAFYKDLFVCKYFFMCITFE